MLEVLKYLKLEGIKLTKYYLLVLVFLWPCNFHLKLYARYFLKLYFTTKISYSTDKLYYVISHFSSVERSCYLVDPISYVFTPQFARQPSHTLNFVFFLLITIAPPFFVLLDSLIVCCISITFEIVVQSMTCFRNREHKLFLFPQYGTVCLHFPSYGSFFLCII